MTDQDKSESTTPTFSTSTLYDYGIQLPIGVVSGNPAGLHKGLAFRPYRTRDEKAISKLRKRNPHPAHDVVVTLCYMLESFGDIADFQSLDDKKKRSTIMRASTADVLYAWVQLRIQALGSILSLEAECPSCEHEWTWSADLNTLEVGIADRLSDLAAVHQLRDPISFGQKTYDKIRVAPPKWGALANISSGKRAAGVGELKTAMVQGAVEGLVDPEDASKIMPASPVVFDEISKYDLEMLTNTIDELFPSIDVSMEMECPACGHVQSYHLQWGFDFFFGASSLPRKT